MMTGITLSVHSCALFIPHHLHSKPPLTGCSAERCTGFQLLGLHRRNSTANGPTHWRPAEVLFRPQEATHAQIPGDHVPQWHHCAPARPIRGQQARRRQGYAPCSLNEYKTLSWLENIANAWLVFGVVVVMTLHNYTCVGISGTNNRRDLCSIVTMYWQSH